MAIELEKMGWTNNTPPALNKTNLEEMETNIENAINKIFLVIYPVGSLYFSTSNSNPSTFLGGTWQAWGQGRVPVGVNTGDTSFNTVEKTGGEKTHTLTVNEMPSHRHTLLIKTAGSGTNEKYQWGADSVQKDNMGDNFTDYVGGGQSHNNLQPYITCYMWKRVS